jgi:hypothetical protein
MVLSSRSSLTQPTMSLLSAPTTRSPASVARRTNSLLPRSPDSSEVNQTKRMVAACGRRASTRATSSSAVVPEVLSSAPGPSFTESKWLPATYCTSGLTVPRSVTTTLADFTPGAGSNH